MIDNVLQGLLEESEALNPQYEQVVELSTSILGFLRECSQPSATALGGKLDQLKEVYAR